MKRWGIVIIMFLMIVKGVEAYEYRNVTKGETNYAYAPAIIKDGGKYHMFYCSSGSESWDDIRYRFSDDGVNWTGSSVALRGKLYMNDETKLQESIAACDPSVIKFGDYYYLYFSDAYQLNYEKGAWETFVGVARSQNISGPYETYTKRGTWEVGAPDVKMLIKPQGVRTKAPYGYGAGQQSVVVKDGKIYMWHTDDSVPNLGWQVYFRVSTNPVDWSGTPKKINIVVNSGDFKYDQERGEFVALFVKNHVVDSVLWGSTSKDGVNWSSPTELIGVSEWPSFANNTGMLGDNQGWFLPGESLIVGFGAPYDLVKTDRWGFWDLYLTNLGRPAEIKIKGMRGDANGDGKIDMMDFFVWKQEYLGSGGKNSDWDGNGKIDMADFLIWKLEYLKSGS